MNSGTRINKPFSLTNTSASAARHPLHLPGLFHSTSFFCPFIEDLPSGNEKTKAAAVQPEGKKLLLSCSF
jgi:hypothetical protein